jgi:Methyltransferase domain
MVSSDEDNKLPVVLVPSRVRRSSIFVFCCFLALGITFNSLNSETKSIDRVLQNSHQILPVRVVSTGTFGGYQNPSGQYFHQESWYTELLRKISARCKHISTFFHHFLPHKQCMNQVRVGKCYDGAKMICFDEFDGRTTQRAIQENRNCVIYSFGSSDDSCFETSIKNRTDCEIHIFDPTSSELKDPRWTYHTYGLTGYDPSITTFWNWRTQKQAECNNCPMRNLYEIMRELNHTWIDILKIDIDGAEWRSLEFVYSYMKTIPATQLQIEMTGLDITDRSNSLSRNGTYGVYELWKHLFDDGFRIFSIEPNGGTCKRRRADRSASFEYALLRTRHPTDHPSSMNHTIELDPTPSG